MNKLFPNLTILACYNIIHNNIEYNGIDEKGYPFLTKDCNEMLNELKECLKNYFNFIKKYPELTYTIVKNKSLSLEDAIFCASKNGNLELVKFLIEQKSKIPNYHFDWDIEMWTSATSGNVDLVKFIIEQGIIEQGNIDFNWNRGLLSACESNSINMIQFMIEQGYKKYSNYFFNWEHVLMKAVKSGCIETTEYIIELGHDDFGLECWDNALYYAVKGGSIQMAQYIIDKRSNEYTEYYFDWGNRMWEAINKCDNEMFELIYKKSLDNEFNLDWTDGIYYIIKYNNLESTKFIINKIKEKVPDLFLDFTNILIYAIDRCKIHIIKYIMDEAVIEDPNFDLSDAMNYAYAENNHEIIKMLIIKGCEMENDDFYYLDYAKEMKMN